jgi:hypothetical protein
MRTTLAACLLLLTACSAPELTTEGSRVVWSKDDPPGCRMLGTLREAEGGGLRSYEANRKAAESRLRNEAGRIGANAMVLLTEVHGESDEGVRAFSSGVPGLTTPNAGCTNCVQLVARAYQCASLPAAPVAEAPPPPPAPVVPAAPPILAPTAPPVAEPPPAAELPPPPAAPQPIYVPAPANGPVIIIIQPPPAPPPPQK